MKLHCLIVSLCSMQIASHNLTVQKQTKQQRWLGFLLVSFVATAVLLQCRNAEVCLSTRYRKNGIKENINVELQPILV